MEIYKKLHYKKVEINWNKNPIKMKEFLSFLTIDLEISRDHLGASNGWTKRYNEDLTIQIKGGIIGGVEYLDTIQYKNKLHNPHNNYVNPFFLFPFMNEEGKRFFVNYYKDEIKEISEKSKENIKNLKDNLYDAIQDNINLQKEIKQLYK